MHVKLLVSIAGNAEPKFDLPDFSFSPGDEVDIHDDLATAWIDAGIAEAPKTKTPRKVKVEPKPEPVEAPATESASEPTAEPDQAAAATDTPAGESA